MGNRLFRRNEVLPLSPKGQRVYTRQAAGRRARLHLRASARIEALYAHSIDEAAPELAHHSERGGDWLSAIKYLQLAAENSARRFGPRQGAGILEHALDLVSRLPVPQRAELDVAILERSGAICAASLDSRALATRAAPAVQHGDR